MLMVVQRRRGRPDKGRAGAGRGHSPRALLGAPPRGMLVRMRVPAPPSMRVVDPAMPRRGGVPAMAVGGGERVVVSGHDATPRFSPAIRSRSSPTSIGALALA